MPCKTARPGILNLSLAVGKPFGKLKFLHKSSHNILYTFCIALNAVIIRPCAIL